jgi:NAD(P)H-flavin reductase
MTAGSAAARPGGAAGPGGRAAAARPMVPRPFRVLSVRPDTRDTFTLALEPVDGVPLSFTPGQFTMLGAFGAGEAPISVSGDPGAGGPLEHTVRDVGGVTHSVVTTPVGGVLSVRGPYGAGWDVRDGRGGDVVIVAGGIGLAPLRSAILDVLAHRADYGQVALLYGARTPGERLYPGELDDWRARGIEVAVTVDQAERGWGGPVGLVTSLIPAARFDPARALALVCGPEVMMRFVASALLDAGLPAGRVRISMERNMECGIGLCGHCQLREFFICTDGPVFGYDTIAGLLKLREA